jgi:hypothetical protein
MSVRAWMLWVALASIAACASAGRARSEGARTSDAIVCPAVPEAPPEIAQLLPQIRELKRGAEEASHAAFERAGGQADFARAYVAGRDERRAWAGRAFALLRSTRASWKALLAQKEDGSERLKAVLDRLDPSSVASRSASRVRAQLDQEIADLRFTLQLIEGSLPDVAASDKFYSELRGPNEVGLMSALLDCQEARTFPRDFAGDCPFSTELRPFAVGPALRPPDRPQRWRDPCVRLFFEADVQRSPIDAAEWSLLVEDLDLDEALRLASRVRATDMEGDDIFKLNFWSHPSLRFDAASKTVVETSYYRRDLLPTLGTNRDGLPSWYRGGTAESLSREDRARWVRELLDSPG